MGGGAVPVQYWIIFTYRIDIWLSSKKGAKSAGQVGLSVQDEYQGQHTNCALSTNLALLFLKFTYLGHFFHTAKILVPTPQLSSVDKGVPSRGLGRVLHCLRLPAVFTVVIFVNEKSAILQSWLKKSLPNLCKFMVYNTNFKTAVCFYSKVWNFRQVIVTKLMISMFSAWL